DVKRFDLADRHGNPMLTLVDNELWTIDYDTFVRVNLSNISVVRKAPLQPAAQKTRQFAGDLFVWRAHPQAVVPRLCSGDVAVVNPDSGTIENVIALGRQPLCCVVTQGGRLIARDWKSGDWLEGTLRTVERPWWRFWSA